MDLTYLTPQKFRRLQRRNQNDQKDGSFFTQQGQNLQLSTNSTVSVSTVNFQDSDIQRFQTKSITEQLEHFAGAFPTKPYSSFTMTLLWMTDQQWEDCYQCEKINMNEGQFVLNSLKTVIIMVNKPDIFSFCIV